MAQEIIDKTCHLKNDPYKETFYIMEKTDKISKGPVRQLQPSTVWKVKDQKGRYWEFREDSLIFHKNGK